MTPFNVVCVLRSGGEYRAEHVQQLAIEVDENLTVDHQFICLSDIDVPGVECIKMLRNWPGWWSKIELFEVFKQAFYLDLDTRLVGNIDEMVTYAHEFTMLRDFGRPTSPASGLMAWNGNYGGIALQFAADPLRLMKKCTTWDCWGDQGFIAQHVKPQFFQDLFRNQVVSYKLDVMKKGVEDQNRIVCFHGKPRPWDIKAEL